MQKLIISNGKLDQEKFGAYAKLCMNSKYGIFLIPVFFLHKFASAAEQGNHCAYFLSRSYLYCTLKQLGHVAKVKSLCRRKRER